MLMFFFYLIIIFILFMIILEQELRLKRINDVHILLHNIPKQNFNMLDILIKHLCKYGKVIKLLVFFFFFYMKCCLLMCTSTICMF